MIQAKETVVLTVLIIFFKLALFSKLWEVWKSRSWRVSRYQISVKKSISDISTLVALGDFRRVVRC